MQLTFNLTDPGERGTVLLLINALSQRLVTEAVAGFIGLTGASPESEAGLASGSAIAGALTQAEGQQASQAAPAEQKKPGRPRKTPAPVPPATSTPAAATAAAAQDWPFTEQAAATPPAAEPGAIPLTEDWPFSHNETAPPEEQLDLGKVRKVLVDAGAGGFQAQMTQLLKSYGVDALSKLDPAQYHDIVAKARAIVAKGH